MATETEFVFDFLTANADQKEIMVKALAGWVSTELADSATQFTVLDADVANSGAVTFSKIVIASSDGCVLEIVGSPVNVGRRLVALRTTQFVFNGTVRIRGTAYKIVGLPCTAHVYQEFLPVWGNLVEATWMQITSQNRASITSLQASLDPPRG